MSLPQTLFVHVFTTRPDTVPLRNNRPTAITMNPDGTKILRADVWEIGLLLLLADGTVREEQFQLQPSLDGAVEQWMAADGYPVLDGNLTAGDEVVKVLREMLTGSMVIAWEAERVRAGLNTLLFEYGDDAGLPQPILDLTDFLTGLQQLEPPQAPATVAAAYNVDLDLRGGDSRRTLGVCRDAMDCWLSAVQRKDLTPGAVPVAGLNPSPGARLMDRNEVTVGERLREHAFIGTGLGCYENFEVREDATEWTQQQRYDFLLAVEYGGTLPPEESFELDWEAQVSHGFSFELDGVRVDMLYYWDGDGVLYFRLTDLSGQQRLLANTDCKKRHAWTDVSENPRQLLDALA